MIKKFITIFLLFSLCLQTPIVYAIQNNLVDYKIQRLDKEQYKHKKVIKKYDPYLLSLTNISKKTYLASSDSEVLLVNNEDIILDSEKRRDIYKKIRRKDIGKSYSIGLPCAAISGAIIGFTLGLGVPVAIGVSVLGYRPSQNAAKENYQVARELYQDRGLPLRFEPQKLNQMLLLVPKKETVSKVIITNLMYETNSKNKFDITMDLEKGAK